MKDIKNIHAQTTGAGVWVPPDTYDHEIQWYLNQAKAGKPEELYKLAKIWNYLYGATNYKTSFIISHITKDFPENPWVRHRIEEVDLETHEIVVRKRRKKSKQ